jgi:hypothetical protein
MDRRGFLSSILALGMAPAIVRAESIMRIVVPQRVILWGDGIHDDTAALQAFFDGGLVVTPEGIAVGNHLRGGLYVVTSTIITNKAEDRMLTNSHLIGRLDDFSPMFRLDEFASPPIGGIAITTRDYTNANIHSRPGRAVVCDAQLIRHKVL